METDSSNCNAITERKIKHGTIRKMFEYAYDNNMINKNPVDKMKIAVKYRQVEKPKSSTQVYKIPEYENILAYPDRMYAETNDSAFIRKLS